jgi:hypothetical protein
MKFELEFVKIDSKFRGQLSALDTIDNLTLQSWYRHEERNLPKIELGKKIIGERTAVSLRCLPNRTTHMRKYLPGHQLGHEDLYNLSHQLRPK